MSELKETVTTFLSAYQTKGPAASPHISISWFHTPCSFSSSVFNRNDSRPSIQGTAGLAAQRTERQWRERHTAPGRNNDGKHSPPPSGLERSLLRTFHFCNIRRCQSPLTDTDSTFPYRRTQLPCSGHCRHDKLAVLPRRKNGPVPLINYRLDELKMMRTSRPSHVPSAVCTSSSLHSIPTINLISAVIQFTHLNKRNPIQENASTPSRCPLTQHQPS